MSSNSGKVTMREEPFPSIYIHAGSGGVGIFAIQLAKHLGATVATTTSTANLDLVKSLCADVMVNYKTIDFEKVPHDCDVVLNSLGAGTPTNL
jgi:NADPH:quinone reductase-like Zn-dependent oxidoreductase